MNLILTFLWNWENKLIKKFTFKSSFFKMSTQVVAQNDSVLPTKEEAIWQARQNLGYLKICLSNDPNVQTRACYQWTLEFIAWLQRTPLPLKEWMGQDWYPESSDEGYISIRVPSPKNPNVRILVQPPFQLEFHLWRWINN